MAVAASAYSAYNSHQAAKASAEQANENAKQAESAGRVEAERVRELGRRQASAAKAQMASNGLDINAPNTVSDVIQNDIISNASKDASMVQYNANSSAAQSRADASNFNKQANQIAVGGALNTASTALNGYSQGKLKSETPKSQGGWA
ncbi:hypothetical protein U2E19_17910 [Acinetobacter baumannii]|uniref:hypothetical protein n=1 Tax=Acinetobacter baumannii TaxID=470 RepID=UPI0022AE2863|nr:hypothetical protein [Acinetobacter baumannii]